MLEVIAICLICNTCMLRHTFSDDVRFSRMSVMLIFCINLAYRIVITGHKVLDFN